MVKKPSLTKELASAAFYDKWFAGIDMPEQDQETYQRSFSRYLKRLDRLPMLALKTIARAASAEANRSIEAYAKLRPLPPKLKTPVELPADPRGYGNIRAEIAEIKHVLHERYIIK